MVEGCLRLVGGLSESTQRAPLLASRLTRRSIARLHATVDRRVRRESNIRYFDPWSLRRKSRVQRVSAATYLRSRARGMERASSYERHQATPPSDHRSTHRACPVHHHSSGANHCDYGNAGDELDVQ